MKQNKSNKENKIVFKFLILLLTMHLSLKCQSIDEIAKKYANIIYSYENLDKFNRYLDKRYNKINEQKIYDSIRKNYRLNNIDLKLDSGFNFYEINPEVKTKSFIKYFKFTKLKESGTAGKYIFAIDSLLNIYKLFEFDKNNIDLFYKYEIIKDSLNLLKFIKLINESNSELGFVKIIDQFNYTEFSNIFDNIEHIKIEDSSSHTKITCNMVYSFPSKLHYNYELYRIEYKFYENIFEENKIKIKEKSIKR